MIEVALRVGFAVLLGFGIDRYTGSGRGRSKSRRRSRGRAWASAGGAESLVMPEFGSSFCLRLDGSLTDVGASHVLEAIII